MISMFKSGIIHDIIIKELKYYKDERGWLSEIFRADELTADLNPAMAYISMTLPNVARGPHEHKDQTDYFCFLSDFTLYLWDNRETSPTFKNKMLLTDVKDKIVIVAPGIVHAYKNKSSSNGLVINTPNKLYAGFGKKENVDEIRYENKQDSPFIID
ncbi:dTDP-4-dehydrorhamnose 3 5-epimerase-like protein [Candidatus Magnetoovum chiemensis]|nr:dTDP-4-dehydrorhamnose 3 5-epimerase-like protein [Candidatus Magnetoovum chiemensis]